MSPDAEDTYLLRERNKSTGLKGTAKEDTCEGNSRWHRFMAARPMLVEPAFLIYNMASRPATIAHVEFVNSLVEKSTLESENATQVDEELQVEIQSRASMWLLFCGLARTLPAIFVTLIVVAYGDIGGRRPGLVLPNVGCAARYVIYVVLIYEELPIQWLVFACFLEGVCGTESVITASAYTYIADVLISVPESRRTFRFAVVHSTTFVAAAVGNLFIGYIIDIVGYLPLFWIFTMLYLIDIVYIIILVPESNPRQAGASFSVSEAIGKTIASFQVYSKKRPEEKYGRLLLGFLLAALMVTSVITFGLFDVIVLYIMGDPFHFSSVEVGYFTSLTAFCSILGDVFGVPILRRLGLADVSVAIIASICGACSFVLIAFSVNTTMLFLSKIQIR